MLASAGDARPTTSRYPGYARFKALGRRIAAARKERELTQAGIAAGLGVSQQIVASYEVGRRRVPLSLLAPLARALAVPVEELIGEPAAPQTPGRRGPPSRMQTQLERIQALPRSRQRFGECQGSRRTGLVMMPRLSGPFVAWRCGDLCLSAVDRGCRGAHCGEGPVLAILAMLARRGAPSRKSRATQT
jgi:transcriptional regulator with XRE-family HTH domain